MSFANYLSSLGGTQRPFVQDSQGNSTYSGDSFTRANRNYNFGQQVAPLSSWESGHFGKRGYNSGYNDPLGLTPGYVDSAGGFLGYGSNADSLYAGSPTLQQNYATYQANEPGRLAAAEAQRLANQQAALQLQQQRQAGRQANAGPSIAQGQNIMGLLAQPQAPQQVQPQAPQQGGLHRGANTGLLGGLHRGGE